MPGCPVAPEGTLLTVDPRTGTAVFVVVVTVGAAVVVVAVESLRCQNLCLGFVGAFVVVVGVVVGAAAGVFDLSLLLNHHPEDGAAGAVPTTPAVGVVVGCAIADVAATPVSRLRAKIIFFMLSSIKFMG